MNDTDPKGLLVKGDIVRHPWAGDGEVWGFNDDGTIEVSWGERERQSFPNGHSEPFTRTELQGMIEFYTDPAEMSRWESFVNG